MAVGGISDAVVLVQDNEHQEHRKMVDNYYKSMNASGNTNLNVSKAETLRRLEATVEIVTGQSAQNLRNQTLTEMRRHTESKVKRALHFCSRFPLIGRGNVMRDKVIDHSAVEDMLARIL